MSKYPIDPALAEELVEFRLTQNLTNTEIGRRLGESATFISKYLNDNMDRDPGDFPDRARGYLSAFRAKLEDATELFETTVTKNIAGRIDMARRTQDLVLIVGEAGEGKSCGSRLYAKSNPGTIYLELASYQRNDRAASAMLFSQLSKSERDDWNGQTSRSEFVFSRLRASHRVVIVDEAHLLDATGRQFWFNFNRDTGCPVILVGNEGILKKIRLNAQHFSRIGVKGEPSLTAKELPAVALKVAVQFSSPDFAEAVSDLAAFVATKPGRLRAVRKNIILAFELTQKNGFEPRKAFREAHRNLVRDYALPSD